MIKVVLAVRTSYVCSWASFRNTTYYIYICACNVKLSSRNCCMEGRTYVFEIVEYAHMWMVDAGVLVKNVELL